MTSINVLKLSSALLYNTINTKARKAIYTLLFIEESLPDLKWQDLETDTKH